MRKRMGVYVYISVYAYAFVCVYARALTRANMCIKCNKLKVHLLNFPFFLFSFNLEATQIKVEPLSQF